MEVWRTPKKLDVCFQKCFEMETGVRMFSSGQPYSGDLAQSCYCSYKSGEIEGELRQAMEVRMSE